MKIKGFGLVMIFLNLPLRSTFLGKVLTLIMLYTTVKCWD